MGEEFSIEDVLIILKRRFLAFLLPIIVLAPLGIVSVMLLPAKYTAQGTILVESQQIPTDFIRSTISAYAQERISVIRQRVMTHNRLLEVADEYDLFPRSLRLSESERVARMRDSLKVNLITAAGGRNNHNRDATIAFTVSYTDRDPRKAYLVANKFMTLFLDEDVRSRTAGASDTTEFFEKEAKRLRNAVAEMEARVAEYKQQNSDALPEHLNMHLSMLERARGSLSAAETSISQLEEERRFLETQLINGASADNSMGLELARLEAELARLRATYRDSYPEIVAKRDEIASLKARMAPSADIQRLRKELVLAEDKLTAAEKLQPANPDAVAAAEAEVEAARTALSDLISKETRKGASDLSGVQIEGRIAVIDNRIRMLNKQVNGLREQIIDLEGRIARTPEVERGIASMSRDYENLFAEYQDVLAKQQDAQLAENLEENQQAEKFSILEPALRPETPSSPDRPKLLVLALFASFAAGGAAALGMELLEGKLRGRSHLSAIIESPPIAIIPYIHSDADKDTSWRRFLSGLTGKMLRKSKLAPNEPEPAI